jgi:D-glycero-alpha-D-manno-heptose 1-phosphate guanylyltransferase
MLRTAVILAGGFGTRLHPVVRDLPKPMAPVAGKPFLEHLLRYLCAYGMTNVIFSTGHLHEKVESHFKHRFRDLNLSYSVEESPLGTGGALRKALDQCEDETLLVMNGDSFFDVAVNALDELHRRHHSDFSLALRRVDNASRYGLVETDGLHRVVRFSEKKSGAEAGNVNGGLYIITKSTYLAHTPHKGPFSLEKDFFEKKVHDLLIHGFAFGGQFIDIGMPEDYDRAQNEFKGFKY